MHPAQSSSKNPERHKEEALVKKRPWHGHFFKYLRIIVAVVKCFSIGEEIN